MLPFSETAAGRLDLGLKDGILRRLASKRASPAAGAGACTARIALRASRSDTVQRLECDNRAPELQEA